LKSENGGSFQKVNCDRLSNRINGNLLSSGQPLKKRKSCRPPMGGSASHAPSRRAAGSPEIGCLSLYYPHDGMPIRPLADGTTRGINKPKRPPAYQLAAFFGLFFTGLSQIGFQNLTSGSMTQTLQRLVFDLPYTLAGKVELFADLFQRKRMIGAQTEE
jgi:hypothetical protein